MKKQILSNLSQKKFSALRAARIIIILWLWLWLWLWLVAVAVAVAVTAAVTVAVSVICLKKLFLRCAQQELEFSKMKKQILSNLSQKNLLRCAQQEL